MVSFNFWSNSRTRSVGDDPQDTQQKGQALHSGVDNRSTSQAAAETPRADVGAQLMVSKKTDVPAPVTVSEPAPQISISSPPARRSFNFFQSHAGHDRHKPIMTTEQERRKERQVVQDLKHTALSQTSSSKSDKRAKVSAEIVRSLIIGPNSISPASKKTKPLSKAQLDKVKSDLAKPKSANKVIAHLRQLDLAFDPSSSLPVGQPRVNRPIHAVCLDASDEEVCQRHFARLTVDRSMTDEGTKVLPSVVTASKESMTLLFNDLSVVSLLSSESFGLGNSIGGPGILSGAVPTAETVINGIETITPQLMSLGFATGQAVVRDHKGIYPPTDRISVLTYWWGLEVVLPPPTLKYLDNAQSISNNVLNFLTVLATVNVGVREIIPFVRYISQYIEFEFSSIKAQNKGKGVVCAATWIMPAALVPRPWDFDPPTESVSPTNPANYDQDASEPGSTQASDDSPTTPRVEDGSPLFIPPSVPFDSHDHVHPDIKLTPPTMGALPVIALV